MLPLYLAGPLFGLADRLHNARLEEHLHALGRATILPQREVLPFLSGGRFDLEAVSARCLEFASDPQSLFVGNIDGPDADSGTAVEFGSAITATKRAIVYRTDIRTSPEKELGVNSMFLVPGSTIILHPCYILAPREAETFYCQLAIKIDDAAKKIESRLGL